uniref:Uncharacterized protein n=1 Tax=Setaria digitata TaxID=48799 RepID=A0A915PYM4_9BILA
MGIARPRATFQPFCATTGREVRGRSMRREPKQLLHIYSSWAMISLVRRSNTFHAPAVSTPR